MAYLSAVVLAAVVCLALAEDLKDGTYCKSTVEQNLDMKKLEGDWWEVESFNTDSFMELEDKCHVTHFYPQADEKKILVSGDYVNTDKEHKKYSFTILDKDPKDDGNLVAEMKILKPALGKKQVEYDVLETDYKNFMVVQICHDAPGTDNDFKAGMLLTRKQEGIDLNCDEIKPQIKAALSNNNLDRSFFQANDAKSCSAVTFPETFAAAE